MISSLTQTFTLPAKALPADQTKGDLRVTPTADRLEGSVEEYLHWNEGLYPQQ